MKPSLLELDTLDDRQELWHLLHRLPPGDRVRFIKWATSTVSNPTNTKPYVAYSRAAVDQARRFDDADHRLTNLAYGDLLMLGSQWKIDMVAAAKTLERWAKEAGRGRIAAAHESLGF